jgi:hypothetical protein
MPKKKKDTRHLLIKSYGEFWRKDAVNWSRGNELVGWSKNRGRQANFWEMKGIYALFDRHTLVYVGQTIKQNLGNRLKQHLKDEFKGRWDSFSWYGIRDVVKKGKDGDYFRLGKLNKKEHPSANQILEAMESIAIRIADPPLNRKRPKFGTKKNRAEHFYQMEPDGNLAAKQSDTIANIEKILKRQQKKIETIWKRTKRIK